jgi:hypothetical protein
MMMWFADMEVLVRDSLSLRHLTERGVILSMTRTRGQDANVRMLDSMEFTLDGRIDNASM